MEKTFLFFFFFCSGKVLKEIILNGLGQGMTSRLIRTGLPDLPFSPTSGPKWCVVNTGSSQSLRSLNHQDPVIRRHGLQPTANGQVLFGGVLPLCRTATGIFSIPPTRLGGGTGKYGTLTHWITA